MPPRTIADVFAANDSIRERLISTVSTLETGAATLRPDEASWSVGEIVEHIAAVDEGICKICAKLLKEARDGGFTGDGTIGISDAIKEQFRQAPDLKLEAPERVRPTGSVSIADSLRRLAENSERLIEMRPLFETVGTSAPTFPHPYFGDMSAGEWLILRGGHESRHTDQIVRILGSQEDS
jgi:hypothetical protein